MIDSKNSVVYSTIACNITTITFQIIALPWSLRRVLWCCSGRTKKTWLSEVVVRGKTSFNDTAVTKTCKQRSTFKRFVFKPDGHKRVFCQLDLQPAFAHLLSQPNWANKTSLCLIRFTVVLIHILSRFRSPRSKSKLEEMSEWKCLKTTTVESSNNSTKNIY